MINLPSELLKLQQGHDLRPLKPFVLLFRNKWNSETNKYAIEETPLDVTLMVIKPNTLSMTLDVNEVAQYNANNITITLSDKNNRFVEGTPNSYFPEGYQLYGSRMVLYYGINSGNRTALFTGVIKDLPTYKPDLYQVDIKLVSPLELLKDIEAKDFSDAVVGETLIFDHTNSDGAPVYRTSGVGVGGFRNVYGNGTRLFEEIDYTIEQISAFGLPCYVTIVNPSYYSSTITADYYKWKTNLSVEQIISGLVGLAGYGAETTDIKSVVWNTAIRSQRPLTASFTLGYRENSNNYIYSGCPYFYGGGLAYGGTTAYRYSKLPTNFRLELGAVGLPKNCWFYYFIGDVVNGSRWNGFVFLVSRMAFFDSAPAIIYRIDNGNMGEIGRGSWGNIYVEKNGNNITLGVGGTYVSSTVNFTGTTEYNESVENATNASFAIFNWNRLTDLDTGASLTNDGIAFNILEKSDPNDIWTSLQANPVNQSAVCTGKYRKSEDLASWTDWSTCSLGATIGEHSQYIQFAIEVSPAVNTDIKNTEAEVLGSSLTLQIVNLSTKTVLEALQDFALVSGYEFGVNRNGVFFFRPRLQSDIPSYVLGLKEIVKIDSIKRELSNFFTKLTLTFAEHPLEFYANTGERPTAIDRYGTINKEIDKPDIIGYDNPELAQAIGPQLLETYSNLRNQLQVTAKLNLALELGDIVNLQRSYPQVVDKNSSDLTKYLRQQTYYRACKIVGLNYNFTKKQMSYTLQDIGDESTQPPEELYEFVYNLPVNLGVK